MLHWGYTGLIWVYTAGYCVYLTVVAAKAWPHMTWWDWSVYVSWEFIYALRLADLACSTRDRVSLIARNAARRAGRAPMQLTARLGCADAAAQAFRDRAIVVAASDGKNSFRPARPNVPRSCGEPRQRQARIGVSQADNLQRLVGR